MKEGNPWHADSGKERGRREVLLPSQFLGSLGVDGREGERWDLSVAYVRSSAQSCFGSSSCDEAEHAARPC